MNLSFPIFCSFSVPSFISFISLSFCRLTFSSSSDCLLPHVSYFPLLFLSPFPRFSSFSLRIRHLVLLQGCTSLRLSSTFPKHLPSPVPTTFYFVLLLTLVLNLLPHLLLAPPPAYLSSTTQETRCLLATLGMFLTHLPSSPLSTRLYSPPLHDTPITSTNSAVQLLRLYILNLVPFLAYLFSFLT